MTYANNFDPDEAPQNMGPLLRSKLFDAQIILSAKFGWKTLFLLLILKYK